MKCPEGKIMRKGGGCIRDLGLPGKGPKLFELRTGTLTQFGYEARKSKLARHRALMKAARSGEPPLSIFRKLNALMILTKRTQPRLSKIYMEDRDYVKEKLL